MLRAVAISCVWVLAAPAAHAFPDAAPWESAATDEGCNQCHFDAGATLDSPALEIAGLPERLDAGAVYRLTLTLRDDAMGRAGFLLSAFQDSAPAGRFEALDERTSAQAAQVRSTEPGAELTKPGLAEWTVEWVAPATLHGAIAFGFWANAANDDQSPFGDATHFKVFVRAPAVVLVEPSAPDSD